jgi:hypothetical protein
MHCAIAVLFLHSVARRFDLQKSQRVYLLNNKQILNSFARLSLISSQLNNSLVKWQALCLNEEAVKRTLMNCC